MEEGKNLTLLQKCALLSGGSQFASREVGEIPSIWFSDGPHGVRKQAGAADHLGLNPSLPATCFPTAAGVANSWNPQLGEELGRAMGEEAAAQQVEVLLGPGMNIKRSPLCGRNFEYFSEDPYLTGKMAAAYVRGIQQNGISACPKHFAVNSQELRRMACDSVVDERTLREIYLTAFEIAVKEGKPGCVMSSYNRVNGEYANENRHLLSEILRGEWGFDGAVVTDWGGSNDHALGVRNGSTIEMPVPGEDSVRELMTAVRNGKITEADIDARLGELLPLIRRTYEAVQQASSDFDQAAHHELARRAARECIVLLKNEEQLLPLRSGKTVAVIGDFAYTPRYQGAGSSLVNATKVETLRDCLAQSGLSVTGYCKGFERHGKPDEELKKEAVRLARRADIVLLCLGLDEIAESEGLDRSHMKLAQNQIGLLEAVSAVNANVAVVLHSGSAVETPWLPQCKALVWAALGGQAGAAAMTDVLTGQVCPSGKLAETWPLCYEDTPAYRYFGGKERTVEYREGLYVGYRYYQTVGKKVSFPFGYGLSYTSFGYRDMEIREDAVSFTVENTGSVPGSEIAQLYIARPDSSIPEPVQQLKGFQKITLEPGESRTVTISFDDKTFRYWNVMTNRWETEGGAYEVRIGASCEDIRLRGVVNVKGSGAPNPYQGMKLAHYRLGQITEVPDEEFEAMLGHPIPNRKVVLDRNLTLGELNHGRSPLFWIVWLVLTVLLRRSLKQGKPNLDILFQYNMPLRALAKMTGGAVSMGMVDGLVMEIRGFWIIGLVRVLVEFVKNLVLNARMKAELEAAK